MSAAERAIIAAQQGRPADVGELASIAYRTIEHLHEQVGLVADESLIELYRRADALGRQAWMLQSHILWEARRRKEHRNDGAIKAVAAEFGISQSQASSLIRIWEHFGEGFIDVTAPHDKVVGVSWYKTLAYTEDPEGWLDYVAERKEENPGYTIQALREEIQDSKGRVEYARDTPPPARIIEADWARPRRSPTPARAASPPPPAISPDRPASQRHAAAAAGTPHAPQDGPDSRQDAPHGAEAPRPAPAPLPPEVARLRALRPYRTAYRSLLDGLNAATPLIGERAPEDVADLLGPPTALERQEQELLRACFTWLVAVFEAREGLEDGPRRRGRPPRVVALAGGE